MPAEDLRKTLRVLAGFDPEQGQPSPSWAVIYAFAEVLADDSGELLAHFKGYLASSDPTRRFRVPPVLRIMRHRQEDVIPPHLESDPGKRRDLFRNFVGQLAADRNTAIFARFIRSGDPHAFRSGARDFVQEIVARAEEFWAGGWFPTLVTLATGFDSSEDEQLREPLTQLLMFSFQKAEKHDADTFPRLWKPARFRHETAAEVWKAFLTYKERTLAAAKGESEPRQKNLRTNFKFCSERFAEQFPSLPKAPAATLPTVRVNRYWQAPLEAGRVIQFNSLRALGNNIVVPCGGPDRKNFHLVSLPSLESRRIESPLTAIDFLISEDAIFPMSSNVALRPTIISATWLSATPSISKGTLRPTPV